MSVALVVAMSENGVIGRGGTLPWHLPADLARFKKLTLGHTLIMGRKTYESIGRLLPGRTTVVLSRDRSYQVAGAIMAASLAEALAKAPAEQENFVIGGEAVFSAALPVADRIYLTLVAAQVEGDVRFPAVDWSAWRLVSEESLPADDRNAFSCYFRVYERLAARP